MIQFNSQIRSKLSWSILAFTTAFLYKILNRYSKLFGIMNVSIIVLLLLSLYYIIIAVTVITYIPVLISICLIIYVIRKESKDDHFDSILKRVA